MTSVYSASSLRPYTAGRPKRTKKVRTNHSLFPIPRPTLLGVETSSQPCREQRSPKQEELERRYNLTNSGWYKSLVKK